MGPIRWIIVSVVLFYSFCMVYKPGWIARPIDPAAEKASDMLENRAKRKKADEAAKKSNDEAYLQASARAEKARKLDD